MRHYCLDRPRHVGIMRPMKAHDFIASGQLLHGEQWKSALAKDLGVSRDTILRLAKREGEIPPSIALAVEALKARRARELSK